MRLTVVGAGIAGSCLARHARDRGHEVTVVADPGLRPASHAALCVIRPQWFEGRDSERCDWAVDWYRSHGWALSDNVMWRTSRGWDHRDGYYTIDPLAPLVAADRLTAWHPDAGPRPDVTVLCRGAQSDLNWRRRHGHTLSTEGTLPSQTVAHLVSPRNVMFATQSGPLIRFGSSVAPDRETSGERAARDLAKMINAGAIPNLSEWRVTHGVRLMPPTLASAGSLRRLDLRVWAIEGFGRVGYSLAPSKTLESLLEIENVVARG